MIFPSRRKAGPDRYLDWKVWIFFAGAALALAGIGMESSVLVGLAIPVLLAGVVLRSLRGGGRGAVDGEESSVDDGEDGDEGGEGEDGRNP
jgi:hypothetical protein